MYNRKERIRFVENLTMYTIFAKEKDGRDNSKYTEQYEVNSLMLTSWLKIADRSDLVVHMVIVFVNFLMWYGNIYPHVMSRQRSSLVTCSNMYNHCIR